MKKTLKKKSKRIPTRQRMKAEKKVREHNRKMRKEKKLQGVNKKGKNRKGLRVPNDCPFKEAVLEEVEAARKRKEQEREERRAKLKESVGKSAGERIAAEGGVERMMEKTAKLGEDVDAVAVSVADAEKASFGGGENSAKAHYKEFAKVVEAADVVLEVLDARDPLGTRSEEVERTAAAAGKRVVLVLNKADLVPKENLTAWIARLRRELPAVAFKSSTQRQASRLGRLPLSASAATESQMRTSKCVGAATLMSLLGNYCRNRDIKTSIRVGVVGFPNVGKSSVVNSLKRGRVCAAGNTPGVTRHAQEVQLDSRIRLLDSPGVVLGPQKDQAALRNAIRIDQLDDPVAPVESILLRCERRYLQLLYGVPSFASVQEFLGHMARAAGRLKKGGIPDIRAAARTVLADWNGGKIRYYTHPPEEPSNEGGQAVVLDEFSKEFSLDSLSEMMETDRQELPDVPLSSATSIAPATTTNPSRLSIAPPPEAATGGKKNKETKGEAAESRGPQSLKKVQKKMLKREKKKRNREEKIGMQLSEMMNSSL